jgi:ABC-2 type transport system permease protein
VTRIRRSLRIAGAFIRVGYLLEISYPLGFVLGQFQLLVPLLTYYFVNQLVDTQGASVGGDYFTFVVIALCVTRVLVAALTDLSFELDQVIQQGRLEMLLVEPIPWRCLPFCLVQWPLVVRLCSVVIVVLLSVVLGAGYHLAGFPAALLITLLGAAASLAIEIIAMSVKVISKRSDPILIVYSIAGSILSGVFFPVTLLPAPLQWLSALLPQTYAIAGARAVLMPRGSQLPGPSALGSSLALLGFCAVLYPIALWLLGRSYQAARRMGVLAGY